MIFHSGLPLVQEVLQSNQIDIWGTAQTLLTALIGGGLATGLLSFAANRHKPPIERQAANDATRKSYADIYASDIESMQSIISALGAEVDRQRERLAQGRLESEEEIRGLKADRDQANKRAEDSEKCMLEWKRRMYTALDHVKALETHIENGAGPRVPERPDFGV